MVNLIPIFSPTLKGHIADKSKSFIIRHTIIYSWLKCETFLFKLPLHTKICKNVWTNEMSRMYHHYSPIGWLRHYVSRLCLFAPPRVHTTNICHPSTNIRDVERTIAKNIFLSLPYNIPKVNNVRIFLEEMESGL